MTELVLVASGEKEPGPRWSAVRTDAFNVVGVGDTPEEAMADLAVASEEYCAMAEANGWPPLPPLRIRMVTSRMPGVERTFSAFMAEAHPGMISSGSLASALV